MNSILTTVKNLLGIDADATEFDAELVVHINSVLSSLTQMGIGPASGFFITGATETWTNFIGTDPLLNSVMTYVYLKVKMIFDPPASSYTMDALKNYASELEWRCFVHKDLN